MSTPAAPQLSSGDVLLQKYEVEIALGQGPAGRSYTARTLGSGKRVVVKVLAGSACPKEAADRLLTKVRDVVSDDLAPVLDWGQHQGATFVVMEHVEGDSLRRLMDEYAGQRKAFTLQESAQLVVRALEAVDAAHRAGVLHRHLKPTALIVNSRAVGPGQGKIVRTVKLTGLGLPELVAPAVLSEALNDRPEARYLAPELSAPNAGGTPQSDIYSAGVLFYELLTGQAPMGTYLSPSQVRDDIPERVDGIVDIALAANAEDRYPSVRDMINDIQRVFSEDAPAAAANTRRTTSLIMGGVLGVAILLAVGLWAFNPSRSAARADEQLRAQVVRDNPLPDAETIKQKLAGHEDMVYIPAGTFVRGRMNAEASGLAAPTEQAAAAAKTGAYYIDRFEWPNQKGLAPMVRSSYAEAEASCASVGKRLCTAAEWERACKGTENLVYGYGDTYDAAKCGGDIPGDADQDNRADRTSGSQESCRSSYGVYDLAGGPREWTSTPDAANARFRVVHGGKRGSPARGSRCAFGEGTNPGVPDKSVSFRCCLGEGEQLAAPAGQAPAGGGTGAPAGAAAGATPTPSGAP